MSFSRNLKTTGRSTDIQVLGDLLDVNITTPVAGEALFYNPGGPDWVDNSISGAGAVTAGTNINVVDLTTGLITVNSTSANPFLADEISELTPAADIKFNHSMRAISGVIESGVPATTQGNLVLNNDGSSAQPNILFRGTGGNANIDGTATDGGIQITDFVQLVDKAEPATSSAGLGKLYKKTGDNGLWWRADGGAPVDLSTAGSGVNAVAAVGTSPNANGLFISGNNISTQLASATDIGMVSTGSQTFAGDKTFNGTVNATTYQDNGAGLGVVCSTGTLVIAQTDVTDKIRLDSFGTAANAIELVSAGGINLTSVAEDITLDSGAKSIELNSSIASGVGILLKTTGINGTISLESSDSATIDTVDFLNLNAGTKVDIFGSGVGTAIELSTDNGGIEINSESGGAASKVYITSDGTGVDAITLETLASGGIKIATAGGVDFQANADFTASATGLQHNTVPVVSTINNVGVGAGTIYKNRTGQSSNFKSILAGTGITVTNNTDDVQISRKQLGASVTPTVAQDLPAGAYAVGLISFVTVQYDTDTMFSGGSPTRLTVGSDGLYEVTAGATLSNSGGGIRGLYIYKNGSFFYNRFFDTGATASYQQITRTLNLVAGDYIEFGASASNAGVITGGIFSGSGTFLQVIKC